YARVARLTLEGVVVEVGGVTSVEARLRVGGVVTAVTVTAGPDPPTAVSVEDASGAAVASTVTSDEIESLPVNGRRWQTFALLTPTVNADPEGFGLLSFRGMASTQNSSRIDGGDDDQSFGAVPRGTGGDSGPEVEDAVESGSSGRVSIAVAGGGGGFGRHSGMPSPFSQKVGMCLLGGGQHYSRYSDL